MIDYEFTVFWISYFIFWYNLSFRVTEASQKENLGIVVQYKVKVKLILGPLVGWVIQYRLWDIYQNSISKSNFYIKFFCGLTAVTYSSSWNLWYIWLRIFDEFWVIFKIMRLHQNFY